MWLDLRFLLAIKQTDSMNEKRRKCQLISNNKAVLENSFVIGFLIKIQ